MVATHSANVLLMFGIDNKKSPASEFLQGTFSSILCQEDVLLNYLLAIDNVNTLNGLADATPAEVVNRVVNLNVHNGNVADGCG